MSSKKTWTGERLETDVFTETSIEHLHRYALAAELVHNKSVLDIACGEGYGPHLLALNAREVTGMDNDTVVIGTAKQKYQRENLEFFPGTVENIPAADHQFEAVVSFETLEHVADQERMIKEIKRVLRPGGILLLSTPDKKNYTDKPGFRNPYHVKELYEEELTRLLHSHFNHVSLLSQQIAFSSVITAEGSDGLDIYSGDYSAINKQAPAGNRLYFIALASDNPLPAVKSSLFNGRSIFAEAVSEKEKMVTGTITYKTGNALLYPFKLIRRLFKK